MRVWLYLAGQREFFVFLLAVYPGNSTKPPAKCVAYVLEMWDISRARARARKDTRLRDLNVGIYVILVELRARCTAHDASTARGRASLCGKS